MAWQWLNHLLLQKPVPLFIYVMELVNFRFTTTLPCYLFSCYCISIDTWIYSICVVIACLDLWSTSIVVHWSYIFAHAKLCDIASIITNEGRKRWKNDIYDHFYFVEERFYKVKNINWQILANFPRSLNFQQMKYNRHFKGKTGQGYHLTVNLFIPVNEQLS